MPPVGECQFATIVVLWIANCVSAVPFIEMPDIHATPLNEFNHSQALLSLSFPTLYPQGHAEFMNPWLRSIDYPTYVMHAIQLLRSRLSVSYTVPSLPSP